MWVVDTEILNQGSYLLISGNDMYTLSLQIQNYVVACN